MALLAQHSYTIRRLIDGKTIMFALQSNVATSQIFTPDPPTYVPNYEATPFLVITPFLSISGETGNKIADLKPGSIVWKINGTAITSTLNTTYQAQHSASSPYALTIKKNMVDVAQMFIECSAIYVQPSTLAEIVIQNTITFNKTTNSGAALWAQAWASPGNIFSNNPDEELQAKCEIIRGSDSGTANATFKWQRLIAGVWTDMTAGNSPDITGFTTHTMTVKAKAILNNERFKCIVTDTKAGSSTNGKTVASYVDFIDMSDPYLIEVELPKGDGIVAGGSVLTRVHVRQAGLRVAPAFYTGKTIRHFRYNAAAALDTTWGTSGYKAVDANRELILTEADLIVGVQTAFGVELNG